MMAREEEKRINGTLFFVFSATAVRMTLRIVATAWGGTVRNWACAVV